MLKFFQFVKNIGILLPFLIIFKPLNKILLFFIYYVEMISWISENKGKTIIKNKLSIKRDYGLRFNLFKQVFDYYNIYNKKACVLEFGVASGSSFKWWLSNNNHSSSGFYGFDTFEGLPEKWGNFYKKGDMGFNIPDIKDQRATFIKGLFQESLPQFIQHNKDEIRDADIRIIHCDADLYSATIFVLSQLFVFLKPGDILFFDEFNVPLHEFKAFKEFTENFYVKLVPVSQVNTFYQVAFMVV